MNRATYYNYIEERLMPLCSRVESRGKINTPDYHSHLENKNTEYALVKKDLATSYRKLFRIENQ